jgi:ParB/RepB/Spo0J family partition protein
MEIAVNRIDYSRTMLREIDGQTINDLKESIGIHGVLQPILVFLNEKNQRYEVICGNHRLCAAKGLGLKMIPAIVMQLSCPGDAVILALNENIQRFDMNPLREGEVYVSLLEQHSIEGLAKKIGKSRYYVEGRINVFKNLHPDLKNRIGATLTLTNAISLAKLPKIQQLEVYNKIVENLNVHPKSGLRGGIGGMNAPSPYCTCEKCGAKHLKGVNVVDDRKTVLPKMS